MTTLIGYVLLFLGTFQVVYGTYKLTDYICKMQRRYKTMKEDIEVLVEDSDNSEESNS